MQPTGKGELTAILLWPMFLATIGNLGLVEAVAYFTARQQKESAQILSTAVGIAVVASMLLIGIGYVILPLVLANQGAFAIQMGRMFLAYIPFSVTATLMMAALQGNARLGVYNALRATVQILAVAGMLAACIMGWATVGAFVVATLAANVVTCAAAVLIVSRVGWLRWPFPASTAGPMLRFGLKLQLGSLASMLNLRLDQMLMSALLSAPLLGIYAASLTVAGLANLASVTLGIVAVPKVGREEDPIRRIQSWGRLLRLCFLLQLASSCVLWILVPYIVRIFFGDSFEASIVVARILIVASVPLGINSVLAVGFRAFDRPLTPSIAEIVSLAVTVTGLTLWLRAYGPSGAAWTSLAAYSVTLAFLMTRAYTQLGVTPRELLEPNRQDWRDAQAMLRGEKARPAGIFR